MNTEITELAGRLKNLLEHEGLQIATAESLTAGLVAATIADIPGASMVLNGGVISYTNDVKHRLLNVPEHHLATAGAVDADTAIYMAQGARSACGADIGVSTTGVAGPEPHQGKSVGTVYIGVASAHTAQAHRFDFDGDREHIRHSSVKHALNAVIQQLSSSR